MAALTEDALRHLAARDAKDAAEAKATILYQEEAMREQRLEFDRQERVRDDPNTSSRVLTDEQGAAWEVIAGMD